MNRGTAVSVSAVVGAALLGCIGGTRDARNSLAFSPPSLADAVVPDAERRMVDRPPTVVTADIQAGIEKHIEEQIRLGGGYFKFASGEKKFAFKLVRVHTEYLANLGPRRHFACVDLVDTQGDVYDVDFFLAGDPGAMTVTETTLHKINGQPFYAWKQKVDGTWGRVPVAQASPQLLGIITGRDEFDFLSSIVREITCEFTSKTRVFRVKV